MLRLFFLLLLVSCSHTEKFVEIEAVPVNKLDSKDYKVEDNIETHRRVPVANLEEITEYKNQIQNIDVTSLDPFYVSLYEKKNLLIPDDFIGFINKSHGLLQFRELKSICKEYILNYNKKKYKNSIDRQKYFDALLYYEWASLNIAFQYKKNSSKKNVKVTRLADLPMSTSWFGVLSRYWTSSSISASEAYNKISERTHNIEENLETYQNRLGYFNDSETFLVDYSVENEPYTGAKKHVEALELTEESFLTNWNKVFRSPPPADHVFKASSRSVKGLPLFTSMPNKNIVRFNTPKPGVNKYELPLKMLYDGLFDRTGLTKKTKATTFPRYPGRSNGWKTYMATLAEQLGVNDDVRYNWARDQWIHKTLLLGLCDIMYNFHKWPYNKVAKLYKNKSATSEEINREAKSVLNNQPGLYLSHAMGYLKTLDLKKQLASQMRDNFKLAEFHHRLSNSYSPYDLIDIMSEVE